MKKYLLILVLALGFVSCSKEFESSIDLAVTDEALTIASAESGSCVITVYANAGWRASLTTDDGADWARIAPEADGKSCSGSGLGFIHFVYGTNDSDRPRKATIEITSRNKTVSVVLTQNGL